MNLKNVLPSKLYDTIDRAGISTTKQILILSVWDIKKLTNLRTDDIWLIKKLVGDSLVPEITTCNKLVAKINARISTGCQQIDNILSGGYQRGTVTEVYGESGSGKTQLGLQAAAHNWPNYCVYICTEDLFPVKRFEQIKKGIPQYDANVNYGENTFVEHITEGQDLVSCTRVRLPKLLKQHNFTLIVIDSIAAPFRSESTNYVQRAEELRELAVLLIMLAQEHDLAVVCVNQVTACFDEPIDMLPALGLAWSNMVSTRLCLRRIDRENDGPDIWDDNKPVVRELSVVFAPDLPNFSAKFIITKNGIEGIT